MRKLRRWDRGRQWSWPLWLPVQFLGIFPSSVLRDRDLSTPWAGEIEQRIFSSAVGARLSSFIYI